MGRPKVQVSQQVANLPAKPTYANNTSDAQIQISPLEYNLGQKAEKRWEKREDSDCRDERGRGKKAPISQLTHSFGVRSEHVYGGERRGAGPFETARVPNPWLSLGGSQILVLLASPCQANSYQLLRSAAIFSRTIKKRKIIFRLNSTIYASRNILIFKRYMRLSQKILRLLLSLTSL